MMKNCSFKKKRMKNWWNKQLYLGTWPDHGKTKDHLIMASRWPLQARHHPQAGRVQASAPPSTPPGHAEPHDPP